MGTLARAWGWLSSQWTPMPDINQVAKCFQCGAEVEPFHGVRNHVVVYCSNDCLDDARADGI